MLKVGITAKRVCVDYVSKRKHVLGNEGKSSEREASINAIN